jgi:CRISPR-associated protein Csb1
MIDITKTAVLSVKQVLEPAFTDEPIKPPTYPDADGVGQYVIYDNNGVKDVVLDTHQSQANRIEPGFDRSGLIPDSVVKVGEESLPLTQVGHRLADAVVRFSNQAPIVEAALLAFTKGDPIPVAQLAPTSLLFGMWDSRKTRTKIVRLFNSEIRGHNVIEVPASGQFISSVPRLEDHVTKNLSSEGLLDCPYSGLGGVIVKGEITRTVWLNVRGIRKYETKELQNYILGLGLFALTYPVDLDLREGCNLVATKTTVSAFNEDGTRSEITLTHADAVEFATKAAKAFGVGDALEFIYDTNVANISAAGKAEAKEATAKAKKSGKAKAVEAVA